MSLHIWTKIRRRESQSASEGGPEIVYKTNKNPNPIYSFFRKNIAAKKTGKLWSANFLSKGNVHEKPNYNKKDSWWEWNQHKGNCLDDFDYSILKTPPQASRKPLFWFSWLTVHVVFFFPGPPFIRIYSCIAFCGQFLIEIS